MLKYMTTDDSKVPKECLSKGKSYMVQNDPK